MELSLAFSPCPNDTYIFHAMINSLVDTEGLRFNVRMADVEELNKLAQCGKIDICKLSYNAFFSLVDKYCMLRSGSALGYNNGPLFVKKAGKDIKFSNSQYRNNNPLIASGNTLISSNNPLIAIPGVNTSAALLLKTAYPNYTNLIPMLFSNIEQAVLNEEVEAGVLIHEGRFTYKDKGLELICDLGEFWQDSFKHPIPLGGIAVNRILPLDVQQRVGRVLKRSILYANEHPSESANFIKENAQEIATDVQKKHIALFVNDFTIDIGSEGENAVQFMYSKHQQSIKNRSNSIHTTNLFIEE